MRHMGDAVLEDASGLKMIICLCSVLEETYYFY